MTYLTFSQLRKKLGNRGRTAIYRDMENERLPRSILLGGRNYWIEEEIDEAMAKLAKCSENPK